MQYYFDGRASMKRFKWGVSLIPVFLILAYYRIGFDIVALTLLLISCWCVGSVTVKIGDGVGREFIRIAVGMCLIGLALYVLLTVGLGGETQFLLILMLPIAIWILRAKKYNQFDIPRICCNKIYLVPVALLMLIMLCYASAPIDEYDALTGHLPITMYAARNGVYNTNIAESITYSQTGMLFYGFSTLFATFGAYKAMTMFNVVLFFLVFGVLVQFSRKLYSGSSSLILALLFFSVPMFFEFSTILYVEMLPIFLTFSGFYTYAELKPKRAWDSLPCLGLLFGCAVISKLTICYTILSGGLIAIILFFIYALKEHISVSSIIKRFLLSGSIFLFILIIPFGLAWYRYGNPVFPWFNGLFQSPYFASYDFVDPFNNSPLGFSIQSILTMVFQTSNNIEMQNGGIGYFLLGVPAIPLSWVIYRKCPLIVWGIVSFAAYGVSTFFTYNLRYYMAIFMMVVMLLAAALSIICNRIFRNGKSIAIILSGIIAVPSVLYISECYPWNNNLINVSDEISVSVYSNLLNEIPEGKRVFSSEPFKGDYNGYLAPNNWHGSAWQQIIEKEGISKIDYISSFDYYLCNLADENEKKLLEECQNSDKMTLVPIEKQGNYELYQIRAELIKKTILEDTFSAPIEVSVDRPYTVTFNASARESYQVIQEIENPGKSAALVRFQINWMDENNQFIDTSLSVYSLDSGQSLRTTSDIISPPEGAVLGILYLGPHEPNESVLAHGYQLQVVETYDYVLFTDEIVQKRVYFNTEQ
ncbi:ArnT family glycosyltransferase [Agathobaculum sp. Marseille-P7918]|uniref:ArnT family glycosyltransferase n=1 Tax=Agathobaculum sp. Marseille-P7918 TaxID=2479843 RepID=UPI000F6421D8|nr:hypothetical protein [Agathobaculum sp. Marseille-P7918]